MVLIFQISLYIAVLPALLLCFEGVQYFNIYIYIYIYIYIILEKNFLEGCGRGIVIELWLYT